MKSWTLSPELQARPDLAAAVEKLRPVLDGQVIPAKYASPVSADWRLGADDDGRDAVVLHLADPSWPDGVEDRFDPRKFDDKLDTRMGLRLLYIQLLGAGNEARIERLVQAAEAD